MFDNVFVLPVEKHGVSVVSLLSQFNVSSKHIERMEGFLMEHGNIHSDNFDFVVGAERFIKQVANKNIYQAVDFAKDALVGLDSQSYYGQALTEILLSLSEKIYDMEDFVDDEELECHYEAYEIVQQVLPYTEWYDDLHDSPAKNRAIELLLRYASKTPDPSLSIPITSLVVNSVDEEDRREEIGSLLYQRCQKFAEYSPLFVLGYLGDAISLWRRCASQLETNEAIDIISYEIEMTSSRLFIDALQTDLRIYQSKPTPPRLEVI